MIAEAWPRPTQRAQVARFARKLRRDPAIALTLALGLPAFAAALVASRPDAALRALAIAALAGVAQLTLRVVNARLRYLRQSDLVLAQLALGLLLAAILIQAVIPASFALYIPVVAIAAAVGLREGAILGTIAIGLYLVPVAVGAGPRDTEALARGVAAAAVCGLVAAGARYYVGNLQRATRELRRATARERRRALQIAGIEEVGRQLAAGPTPNALDRVMDVLVRRFGYRYVSIYLARPDGLLTLGAQRGYATPIETFDGTYGVVGRVMRRRRAELVADVSVDPDYAAANSDVVSEISAPLLVADEFLGMVNVESAGRRLDETDLRIVTAVADRLATYVALGRERERLADLSIRDPLTRLHNRRYLDEALAQLLARRARRTDSGPLSVILFDLDDFGRLNSRHGLAVGDEALRMFGRLLADSFREADIVARYGGEEFLVALEDCPLPYAERRANEVRKAFAAATTDAENLPAVTVSAGCAAPVADRSTAEDLVAAANVGLSMAKRAGRNRVVAVG